MKKTWTNPEVISLALDQTMYTNNPGTVSDACYGDNIYDIPGTVTDAQCS